MMITIRTSFVIFILMTTALTAQPAMLKFNTIEAKLDYAKKNFDFGLRSENNGVVESTLMLVAKLKITYPSENIANLLLIVDSIASTGASVSLRYKAFLVSNMCDDPEWFAQNDLISAVETDLFYLSAARRLQVKMLGISSL